MPFSIRPSRVPFRLQLEDTLFGFEPNIKKAIEHYTVCKRALGALGGECPLTPTGHVLAVAPYGAVHQEPKCAIEILRNYYWSDDIVLSDAVHIFTSEKKTFRCFLTNVESKRGYAVRIENSSIWLLVSDGKGLSTSIRTRH